MFKTSKQVKDKIKNLASKTKGNPQELLQIYMFERLLERISLSKYNENFIIKGGLLLSSILGVDLRTTRDIDTTIKGFGRKIRNYIAQGNFKYKNSRFL